MTLVTLEMGPTWKMQLLLGVLEERGVPGFVEDSNMKTIDPFATGALSFDARLKVPEDSLAAARTALEEARRDGLEENLAEDAERAFAADSGLEASAPEPTRSAPDDLTDLGRRLRWAALFFWLHPWVFSNGVAYVRGLSRTKQAPTGNGLTLLTLVAVTLLWGAIAFEAVQILQYYYLR